MSKQKKQLPFLISPLHDPEGQCRLIIEKWASRLANYYSQVILGVTKKTHPNTINFLKKLDFILLLGDYPYGEAHRQAIDYGLKNNGKIFHCSDFDRILHWVSDYSKELKDTLEKVNRADYLIVGRTKRALATHPLSWQLTEKINNALLSKVLGLKVDISAGSFLLNQKAAKIVLGQSQEIGSPVLAEWPLLVKKAGLKVGYQAANGLEWEDPDRFQKEIKKMGYQKWLENYDTPNEWQKRLEITNQMAKFILSELAV